MDSIDKSIEYFNEHANSVSAIIGKIRGQELKHHTNDLLIICAHQQSEILYLQKELLMLKEELDKVRLEAIISGKRY